MSDWLHNLPVGAMALIVFGVTYLVATVIYALVMALAVGERARSFKAVSPGMLPPLGIIFGLFVAFTAASGRLAASTTTALSALASRLTAAFARSFAGTGSLLDQPDAQHQVQCQLASPTSIGRLAGGAVQF
jgi:hypothetical protein